MAVKILLDKGDNDGKAAQSTAVLQALGHGIVGWIWLDLAILATDKLKDEDNSAARSYLRGKVKACQYFADVELPQVAAWLAPLRAGSSIVADMAVEEFLGETV